MAEPIKRCAIYTRKSTEDGLEQEFNSLDAQYEACAAYALSQRHEGWEVIEARYDDGGYSGGTMERPGLKRLLEDIEAGLIDIVLLYKIDRLTRSLSDFSRIVDVLDKAEASFVSITQAFNTTTSMGRLTLNMLLSFAQFEREVTGERIRDKIAASKKKGLWMGGPVPLGYRVKDRKLVVVPKEAGEVRHIMQRYLALGTVPALAQELEREGYRTKAQKRASGPHKGGCLYRRGTLYHLLANPIYRGKLKHKGEVFEGEHEAIVDEELWDSVQFNLKENASGSSRRKGTKQPSLLIGLVQDEHGRAMTPSHSGKSRKTQRYRYYVTRADQLVDHPACRVPASDLEQLVCEHLAAQLRDDGWLMDIAGPLAADAAALRAVREKAGRAATDLESGDAATRADVISTLVATVACAQDGVTVELDAQAIAQRFDLGENAPRTRFLRLPIPAVKMRSGHQLRLVVPGREEDEPAPPRHDKKLIALVHEALEMRDVVLSQPERSMSAIAKDLGKCRTRLTKLVGISCLAPDIIEIIVEGRQPIGLTSKTLLARPLPWCWDEQRKQFAAP
ncbi:recombinase family protein [Erythrobacter sp. GH1-10]|uniref:recombinase family protein n=1 Tax=Erythrobacter sp. GH1-10 TaxID=3349334 RepID=UPI0038782363